MIEVGLHKSFCMNLKTMMRDKKHGQRDKKYGQFIFIKLTTKKM